ncbi:MAG TPA: tetratricopeptide repeat protein [Kofleriaceae bacterium]|nr:tetratricopeptide repeat protein [Kofleriaceae bacterium]
MAAPGSAQSIGRVELTVLDDAGKPVAGAEIVVTCEELTRFRQNAKTDKRGRVAVSFVDSTKEYLFHIEAEGFVPVEQYIRARPPEATRREIRLVPRGQGDVAVDGQPVAGQASYTPAQIAFNEGVEALRSSAADATKLDAAVAKFEEALEKDGRLAEAWSALAVAQAEREDWPAAIEAARRFIELEGAGDASTYRVLYRAHQAQGDTVAAQQAREALARLGGGKDSATFAHNEGVAAVRIGDDETALERFEEALRLSPDLAPAALGMAVIHLRRSQFQEAAAAAERLLAIEPENVTGLTIRWQAYRALGDPAKEKEALQALAARDPAPIVADLLNGAKQLFEAGDPRAASAQLEQATQLAPDNAEVHYRLGLCYVSLDDKAGGKRHLERFLALAPDHPESAAAREMLSYLE